MINMEISQYVNHVEVSSRYFVSFDCMIFFPSFFPSSF